MLLGDFNIHIDNKLDCYTKQFHDCLKTFGLVQHVKTSTHTSGHILDLIVTKKEEKHVCVSEPLTDYFISDHCFVSCVIEQLRPPLVRKVIKARNWTSVSSDNLQTEFKTLGASIEKSSNVNDLTTKFTKSLTDIVEKHAPQKERTILCRPTVPWYSGYLKQLKQFRRSIEKIFMSYRSELTKKVYSHVRNVYSAEVARAKNEYYQTRISEADGSIKKLFAVTSDLLGRSKDNPLPLHTSAVSLANNFLRYFADKIIKLRDDLDGVSTIQPCSIHSVDSNDSNINLFTAFKPLSEIDITKLVKTSKPTTCELDVIPTSKLKRHFTDLAPLVTEIVNRSLLSGVFPDEWKSAVIKPLLKKKGLPLELQNYRPVSNLTFLSKILEKTALN